MSNYICQYTNFFIIGINIKINKFYFISIMTEKSKRQKYINHSIYVDTFSVPILVQLNYYSEILDYTPPQKSYEFAELHLIQIS